MHDLTQVLKMEAGPEFNALIATEVMEWNSMPDPSGSGKTWWIGPDRLMKGWSPSTDMAAAWEAWEVAADRFDMSAKIQCSSNKNTQPTPKYIGYVLLNVFDEALVAALKSLVKDSDGFVLRQEAWHPWTLCISERPIPHCMSIAALLTIFPAKDGPEDEEG